MSKIDWLWEQHCLHTPDTQIYLNTDLAWKGMWFSPPFLICLLRCTSHAESIHTHTHTHAHKHSKSVSLQQLLHLISWGIDFLLGIKPHSSLVILPILPRTERRTANTAAGLDIVSVAHKQERINTLCSDENIVVWKGSASFSPALSSSFFTLGLVKWWDMGEKHDGIFGHFSKWQLIEDPLTPDLELWQPKTVKLHDTNGGPSSYNEPFVMTCATQTNQSEHCIERCST